MNNNDMDTTLNSMSMSRTSLGGSFRERSIPQMQVPGDASSHSVDSVSNFGIPPVPHISHVVSPLGRTHLAPLSDFPSLEFNLDPNLGNVSGNLGNGGPEFGFNPRNVGGNVDHNFLRSNSISCLSEAVLPMYDVLNTPSAHLRHQSPTRSPNSSNRPYASTMQYSRSSEHLPVVMENHQPHRRGSAMLKATSFASLHRQQSPKLPYRKPSFLTNESFDQMHMAEDSPLSLTERRSPSLGASQDVPFFNSGIGAEQMRNTTPQRQSSLTSSHIQYVGAPPRHSASTTSLNSSRKTPRTRNSNSTSTSNGMRMTLSPNRRLADKIAEHKQKQMESDRKFAELMGEDPVEGLDGDDVNEEMDKTDEETSEETNRRNSGGNNTTLSVPGTSYHRSLSHPNLKMDNEDRPVETPSPDEKRGSVRSVHSSTSELRSGMKEMGMEETKDNSWEATTGLTASTPDVFPPSVFPGHDINGNNINNINHNNKNSQHSINNQNNMFHGGPRRRSSQQVPRRAANMQFGALPTHHNSGLRIDRYPSEPSERMLKGLPPMGPSLDSGTISTHNLNSGAYLQGAPPSKSLFEQFLDEKSNRRGHSIHNLSHSMSQNVGQGHRPAALSPAGGSMGSMGSMGSVSLNGFHPGAGTNSAPIHIEESNQSLNSMNMSSGSFHLQALPYSGNENGNPMPTNSLNMPLNSLNISNLPRLYQDPAASSDAGYQ